MFCKVVALRKAGLKKKESSEKDFTPSCSSWAEEQPGCWEEHHPGQW